MALRTLIAGIAGVVEPHAADYPLNPERPRPIDADLPIPDRHMFAEHTGWYPDYTYRQTITDRLGYWRERVRGGAHVRSR